jgi:hypothetical protein
VNYEVGCEQILYSIPKEENGGWPIFNKISGRLFSPLTKEEREEGEYLRAPLTHILSFVSKYSNL